MPILKTDLVKNALGCAAALSLVTAFSAIPAPASAEHFSNFYEAGNYCVWDASGMGMYRCSDVDTRPATQVTHFAAIAVSDSTLSWGSSWGYGSKAAAQKAALAQCRRQAHDCKAQVWGQFNCVALATSNGDRAWGTSYASFPGTAKANALAVCRNSGGKSCVVVAHPCSED